MTQSRSTGGKVKERNGPWWDSKCKEEMCAAERLYGEVNRRLQDAIKNKNMNEITVVQGLLEVTTKKMESTRKNLDKCQKEKEEIDAKRRRVMDKYSSTLAKFAK